MSAPNMATITASLERSLQNCSLNHHHQSHSNGGAGVGFRTRTRTTTSSNGNSDSPNDDATLDLNSQISLPYHWEQCLDLKFCVAGFQQSGEIYYINWRTGMKAKEDPRTSLEDLGGDHHHYYYTDEDEDEDEDEDNDSSSSSSSSSEVYSPPEAEEGNSCSASCSRNEERNQNNNNNNYDERSRQVLVVAGCKVCLMYFMVPKQVQLCPKCTTAQLLHFN